MQESQSPLGQTIGSTVDRTRSQRRQWGAQDLSLIAVFAALLVVATVVPPLQIGNLLSVPLTLQTLIITLTGLLLGAGRAFAAVGLYTLLGLIGLPIFSGFRGGIAILAGPSAGYILSFPFAAALVGAIAAVVIGRNLRARAGWLAAASISGLLLNHVFGIAGMIINGKLSLTAAALADAVFIPGDLVKIAVAVILALSLHRAFPQLLRNR